MLIVSTLIITFHIVLLQIITIYKGVAKDNRSLKAELKSRAAGSKNESVDDFSMRSESNASKAFDDDSRFKSADLHDEVMNRVIQGRFVVPLNDFQVFFEALKTYYGSLLLKNSSLWATITLS
jgi:hypothetical protein